MDQTTITLIVSVTGITATLISSSIGHYYTSKGRSSSFRQLLYSKQLEIIVKLIQKQSRFKIFAILVIDKGKYLEQAINDIRECVKNYSELTEESAVLLPTELYVEVRKLNRWMVDFLEKCDNGEKLVEDMLIEYSAIDLKIVLIARGLLGVDELSVESVSLFSSKKSYERITNMDKMYLAEYVKNKIASKV